MSKKWTDIKTQRVTCPKCGGQAFGLGRRCTLCLGTGDVSPWKAAEHGRLQEMRDRIGSWKADLAKWRSDE